MSFGKLPRNVPPRQRGSTETNGTVIVIGGAEDKIRDRVILNRFTTLAGGADGIVVVISTASSLGLEAGERYREIFTGLGIAEVRPLHAMSRSQANDPSYVRQLDGATGIFLTGGNQLRLSSTIGGTLLAEAVMELPYSKLWRCASMRMVPMRPIS